MLLLELLAISAPADLELQRALPPNDRQVNDAVVAFHLVCFGLGLVRISPSSTCEQ
jgi:hypothetical protein